MKEQLKISLAKTIRQYNKKGWSPATSTNYSFRCLNDMDTIVVSRSGVDKAKFKPTDFIEVDRNGQVLPNFETAKPSAETLIHCKIYDLFPQAMVVLHSHAVYPVLLSEKVSSEIVFEGLEVQKGFEGQTTHENRISVAVLPNSQNMTDFGAEMTARKSDLKQHCFVIEGHGTYAWGIDLFEAKRHLETLDYLCELTWKSKHF